MQRFLRCGNFRVELLPDGNYRLHDGCPLCGGVHGDSTVERQECLATSAFWAMKASLRSEQTEAQEKADRSFFSRWSRR